MGSRIERKLDARFRYRELTYKTHEAAKRSFFRFVCKRRLYCPLRWYDDRYSMPGWYRFPRKGFKSCHFGTPFTNGIPEFRSWKSEAYKQWDNRFQAHRERWIEEDIELIKRREDERYERIKQEVKEEHDAWLAKNERWQAKERKRLHAKTRTVKTFQALAGFAALKK